MLGGRPIATITADPIRVNRLQASSTVGMPGIWLGTTLARPAPISTPVEAAAAAPVVDGVASAATKTDLASLRMLTLHERRALRTGSEDGATEAIHVALDLVQARQSPTPCETFADALAIIETENGGEHYAWAITQAAAPTGCDSGDPRAVTVACDARACPVS